MKKAISVLLCLCLVLSVFTVVPFAASAAEVTEESVGATSGTTGDCTWTLDDNGTLTISGNGAMGNYYDDSTLPWGKNITSVVIENGVTSIGNFAFYGCTGLTSVTIGNSVTSIGSSAFRGCSGLTSITIPDSVTSIGSGAFYGTTWYNNQPNGLVYAGKFAYNYKGTMPANTSITIKDGTKGIAASALRDCTSLTSVTIPDSVTSIGVWAFYGCTGLTSVTIPNSVTSIDSYAFNGCTGLTSVTIGNSVTSIGEWAFYGCTRLTSVHISDIAAWCNIAFSSDGSNPLECAHNLYLKGVRVTDLIIPDGVTSIGERAFSGCNGLTSVTIPNSVTSIGSCAFYWCTGLTSVTIGNSVTSIGDRAFYNCLVKVGLTGNCVWVLGTDCALTISGNGAMGDYDTQYSNGTPITTAPWGTNIKSVVIEDGVTNIGNYAFCGCTGLTSVTIPDNVTSISKNAFDNTAWYNNQPNGLVYAGKFAYKYKGTMPDNTSISLQDGTKGIADSAFYGCTGLTSVTIPDSVTSIGEEAFRNCTGLTSVTIPDNVTSIGSLAFYGCAGLTSVTIPDSVTSIGVVAFYGCSSDLIFNCNPGSAAEAYAINYGYKTNNQKFLYTILEDGTVEVSTYLDDKTDVVIPATYQGKPVKSLKNWLFLNNSSITSVTLPDSLTRIGKGAFYSCVELKSVTMGNNVTEIGESAFEKCLFLESITLSNQLETIGDEAFYDCRRLKQLNLPNTLTTIGEEAFTNCRSLTELVIPKGVQNLGNEESVGFGMFENCKNLKEITIPESVGYIRDNAFDGCGQVTIRAKVNSYAAQYAAANQLAFSKIDSEPVGDANGDSKINVRDVTTIQRFVGEFVQFTDEQLAAADVDDNGIVDINDATYLQMYLAEYDVTLG